jgi:hypothetical protein
MKATSGVAARPLPDRTGKTVQQTHASFQYVGTTGLTVVGGVTGTRYRFDSPGAIVAVDFRDQVSLRPIPHLRRVYLP